jgi:hypothetical protein
LAAARRRGFGAAATAAQRVVQRVVQWVAAANTAPTSTQAAPAIAAALAAPAPQTAEIEAAVGALASSEPRGPGGDEPAPKLAAATEGLPGAATGVRSGGGACNFPSQ